MAPLCVIFDIDGTLCDTNAVDDECYRQAVAAALDVPTSQIDWTGAPHQTDSGIARWLWERWRGRAPAGEELHRLRLDFLRRLDAERVADVRRFRAINAAPQFLESLRRAGAIVGIATGGWRVSAELKLSTVGVATDLLHATADDGEARVDIFALAWARATAHSARPGATVLIGDSVWDVATARRLGWRFLGVGRGADATQLREAGAALIVPDYAELDAGDTLERCP
jgi:phosphoglycolate phosphatase-like HAD superfamily hydrolase